jgi:hypothetical protein
MEVVLVQPGILFAGGRTSHAAKDGIGGLPVSPHRTGHHPIERYSPFAEILAEPRPLAFAQRGNPIVVSRPEGCLPVPDHDEFCQSLLLKSEGEE